MAPEEWDALPWHLSRLYIDGFYAEKILESNNNEEGFDPTEIDLTEDGDPAALGFQYNKA